MSCPRCLELHVEVEIRHPSDLRDALRVIRANLTDGTLESLTRGESGAVAGSVKPLCEEGPWNDLESHEFRCRSCGAGFALSVETYHGTGGRWAPLAKGSSE